MTRDPFGHAAIADDVEPHTWRRLFGVRAKTIPLREMPSMTSTMPSGNTRAVGGIAPDLSSPVGHEQCGALVQRRLTNVVDRRIVSALQKHGGIISAKDLVPSAKVSLWCVRDRLDRLVADGFVVNVPGRGYRRAR